jgi:hypothetical protein
MKQIAIAGILASAMIAAPAVQVVENTWIFNEEDMRACVEGGECIPITHHRLEDLLRKQHCVMRET